MYVINDVIAKPLIALASPTQDKSLNLVTLNILIRGSVTTLAIVTT
ncbi:MAG: hypothetical protein LM582_10185 [Desulfurococcaceae archaeon]|nr:hypothetical protein [Desulfurococcaceae archaeon]